MTPLAAEAVWAVFGGLIPIIGALATALIIWRAVKDPPDNESHDKDPDDNEPRQLNHHGEAE
jgi:hypothetical protein